MASKARLLQDEPWIFLDVRKTPVHGRKLTFQLDDGTNVELDLTMQEYRTPATVKARLATEITAHDALIGI